MNSMRLYRTIRAFISGTEPPSWWTIAVLAGVVIGMLGSTSTTLIDLRKISGEQAAAADKLVAVSGRQLDVARSLEVAVRNLDINTSRLMRWSIGAAVAAALLGAGLGAVLTWSLTK